MSDKLVPFSKFKSMQDKRKDNLSGVEKSINKMGIPTSHEKEKQGGKYMIHQGNIQPAQSSILHKKIEDHGFEKVREEDDGRQVHYSNPKSEETLRVDHSKDGKSVKIHHYTY